MFHTCHVCLSIQPVESLTQREQQDAYEEKWGDRKEQHHSHKAAALVLFCGCARKYLKYNTKENEHRFYLYFQPNPPTSTALWCDKGTGTRICLWLRAMQEKLAIGIVSLRSLGLNLYFGNENYVYEQKLPCANRGWRREWSER